MLKVGYNCVTSGLALSNIEAASRLDWGRATRVLTVRAAMTHNAAASGTFAVRAGEAVWPTWANTAASHAISFP